jgi:four helix bundle protein
MDKYTLQERLKKFAIGIVLFADELPYKSGYKTVKDQIVRSGPSCAANYRSACRAKSDKDFISKMGNVEEELDETMFWLEFTVGLSEEWRDRISKLWKEGNELISIVVTSINTAKMRRRSR